MNNKILKAFIAIVLITTLTGFNVIFLGSHAMLAIYAGMTNVENVVFDAYFKEGDTQSYAKQSIISQGENLFLSITLKGAGVLDEGKIKIENANFTIAQDSIDDNNVKAVHPESNEIELNQVVSGNVTISVPIKFDKNNAKNISYFDQEAQIKLSGIYKKDDVNQEAVEGQVTARLMWTENSSIQLSQEIEKYIDRKEQGILLQQKVSMQIENNALPVQKQAINVTVPELDGQMPTSMVILYNGKKLSEAEYTLNDKTISIIKEQDNNNIVWGNGTEEYKLIYTYDQVIEFRPRNVSLGVTANVQLYTKQEEQKQDNQVVAIDTKGSVVSVKKDVTASIDKGYMYANSENSIDVQDKITVEVSGTKQLGNDVTLEERKEYVNNSAEKFGTNNSVVYKTVQINKAQMIDILGVQGNISLQDGNGTTFGTLKVNDQADENGNIVYTINEPLYDLKMVTSNPEKEGNLDINVTKAVNGTTGYGKDMLKGFVGLESTTTMKNVEEEMTASKTTELKDTISQASLEINKTEWSTLQKTQDVQFLLTLKSDAPQYDLYKNPKVEVTLPKEVDIDVSKISQLNFEDQIKIANISKIQLEDGSEIISFTMEGEQTRFASNLDKGIQISMVGDINIANTVASQSSQVNMVCTNENRSGETINAQVPVQIKSKTGVLMINTLENYNNEGEVTQTTDDKAVSATLDAYSGERVANQRVYVINNYDAPISDISIVGKVGEQEEKNVVQTKLQNEIAMQNKQAIIYYSDKADTPKDSDEWKQNLGEVQEVKSFKVELQEELPAGDHFEIAYGVYIPENLQSGQKAQMQNVLEYSHVGNAETTSSTIDLNINGQVQQEVAPTTVEQAGENFEVAIVAQTGSTVLKENDTVMEGQGITYRLKITNKGTTDLNNVVINATNTNAIYYNLVEYQTTSEAGEQYTVHKNDEDESLTSKEFTFDSLKVGETKEISYQISVKEVQEEGQVLSGEIKVKADNCEEQTVANIKNNIAQGDLKLKILRESPEEVELEQGMGFGIMMYVKNISDQIVQNVDVEVPIAEELQFEAGWKDAQNDNCKFIEENNGLVKFEISQIAVGDTAEVYIPLSIKQMNVNNTSEFISQYAIANYNNVIYTSNHIEKTVNQTKTNIVAEQTTNIEGNAVKHGDNVKFFGTIENTGIVATDVIISGRIQSDLKINSIQIEGKEDAKVDILDSGSWSSEITLQPNEKVQVSIDTSVNLEEGRSKETVTNSIEVSGKDIDVQTNVIELELEPYQLEDTEEEEPEEPEDSEDPETPEDPDESGEEEKGPEVSNISGTAWLDQDENGERNSAEKLLSNIPVMLIEEATGNIANTTNTDEDGEYLFENVVVGNYVVVFRYDTGKYGVTSYQKEGISDSTNSDVVASTITLQNQEVAVAKTKTLQLSDKELNNIDAGFIEGKIFDLKLQKTINKIIVQNSTGTRVINYDKSQLAKIELDAKYVANSNIIIEYNIAVTNEGEVAGYANEIVDYIPNDLSFSSEINKAWYQSTDGNICTKDLSNQIINPGETKNITLTLTKTMTEDNTGTVANKAEIKQASNDAMLQDQDSTPNNKKSGEDDMSSADVIVSIRTGQAIMYISLIISSIAILGTGIYYIKRKVLD